jgi:HD-GYP domain-containing protein (c-di-GMP phosphodiesterase class II)
LGAARGFSTQSPRSNRILGFFCDMAMPSTLAISTVSTLQRIQSVLRKVDTLPIPHSLRPRVEIILVREAAKLMDRALPWQRGHGRRTAALARTIGSSAGLSRDSLHHLTLAALLHDIGLLALPPALVSDLGCLDVQSYADRQSHPRVGAQWLEPYRFLNKASVIIAHHHERWDGSGYPYGIRGTFIPIEARILAIADAFDAIHIPGIIDQDARDRAAYRILTVGAGAQFDPHLVDMSGHCLQRPNLRFSFN